MGNLRFKGKKIYIVEDEPQARELICENLIMSGFECYVASDGKEALGKVCEVKPDIIIMDLGLPYMNGLITIQKIKEKKEIKDIPIIVLTCFDTKINRERCYKLGVNRFMVKPTSSSDLILAIKTLLIEPHIT